VVCAVKAKGAGRELDGWRRREIRNSKSEIRRKLEFRSSKLEGDPYSQAGLARAETLAEKMAGEKWTNKSLTSNSSASSPELQVAPVVLKPALPGPKRWQKNGR
jgi:hypothetical protein